MRRLKVLLLPPQAVGGYRDGYAPDACPDPFDLERRLAAEGIELTTLDPAGRPWNPFVGRHPLLEGMDIWRALRILLFARRYDVVLSVMEAGAAPLVLLRRLFGFRTPIALWDLAPAERWRFRRRLQDFVLPRVQGVLALPSSQVDYIARRWSPAPPVIVVGGQIDTDFFRPMGTAPAGDYIFSIGQDVGRDFATLIAAMDGVATTLRLRTSRKLPEQAARMAHVEVLRQRVSDPALRDLYAGSRFVVAPLTPTENANGVTTIHEAGAMGKAIIVSDNAAIRDFVIPEETCLLVPCGDVGALRAAIRRLLADPDLCARLGRNARHFVTERWGNAAFATRFAAAIRAVAGD